MTNLLYAVGAAYFLSALFFCAFAMIAAAMHTTFGWGTTLTAIGWGACALVVLAWLSVLVGA